MKLIFAHLQDGNGKDLNIDPDHGTQMYKNNL